MFRILRTIDIERLSTCHYKSFSLKIPGVKIHATTSYDVIHYHSFLQSTDVNCIYSLKNILLLLGFPGGSDGKASAYNAGDPGLIPGSGRFSGEGNGNPLQYSRLDGREWQAIVHGVTKSQIRQSYFTSLHKLSGQIAVM